MFYSWAIPVRFHIILFFVYTKDLYFWLPVYIHKFAIASAHQARPQGVVRGRHDTGWQLPTIFNIHNTTRKINVRCQALLQRGSIHVHDNNTIDLGIYVGDFSFFSKWAGHINEATVFITCHVSFALWVRLLMGDPTSLPREAVFVLLVLLTVCVTHLIFLLRVLYCFITIIRWHLMYDPTRWIKKLLFEQDKRDITYYQKKCINLK